MADWANTQRVVRTVLAILCAVMLAVSPLACSASVMPALPHAHAIEQQYHPCCPQAKESAAQLLCCVSPQGESPAHASTSPQLTLASSAVQLRGADLAIVPAASAKLAGLASASAPPRLTLRI